MKVVKYKKGEGTLAPFQTILNSISNNNYTLKDRTFNVSPDDFVGWQRLERESLTLILVVDVSRSTFPYLRIFAEILNSLTRYFKVNKDRIGLISLQGTQATILNHPTNNYRVITRNLLRLKIHGETPLADGLFKALAMVKLEKHRKPGSRNSVILLSDCYPEPLTGEYDDYLKEPAYREAIRAASIYRQHKLSLLIIDPSFIHEQEKEFTPGERLAVLLTRESRGKLVKLYQHEHAYQRDTATPTPEEIERIIHGVEELLGQKSGADTESKYYRA